MSIAWWQYKERVSFIERNRASSSTLPDTAASTLSAPRPSAPEPTVSNAKSSHDDRVASGYTPNQKQKRNKTDVVDTNNSDADAPNISAVSTKDEDNNNSSPLLDRLRLF